MIDINLEMDTLGSNELVDKFLEDTDCVTATNFELMITDLLLQRYGKQATIISKGIAGKIGVIQSTTPEVFNFEVERNNYCDTKRCCLECELFKHIDLSIKCQTCEKPTDVNIRIVREWYELKQEGYKKKKTSRIHPTVVNGLHRSQAL